MQRKKTTKEIGKLSGKLLIFGGVYSNLQSLEKLMSIADAENISTSNIICTGDIVGYCAQPEEVVQTIKQWKIHCIAGNVEIQLRENKEDCGCNFEEGSRCSGFSQLWYPFAQSQLSPDSLDWMNTLPDFIQFEYSGLRGFVLHGSYYDTSEFIFKSTPWEKKQSNFNDTEADVILSGHCGLPFHQQHNAKLWLNPGVIGMPANDGSPKVWYMIIDSPMAEGFAFEHRQYAYDHEIAAQLMKEKSLTPEYAKTLKTGLWDNCEILPTFETALQGKPISF